MFDGWDERHGIAAGPMTAIIDHLYYANEDDVYALVAWLASLHKETIETNGTNILIDKITDLEGRRANWRFGFTGSSIIW